jgi:hypothetical protein
MLCLTCTCNLQSLITNIFLSPWLVNLANMEPWYHLYPLKQCYVNFLTQFVNLVDLCLDMFSLGLKLSVSQLHFERTTWEENRCDTKKVWRGDWG